MVEIYLAYLLICGYEGNCEMFKDVSGTSTTISDCRKKLDEAWIRVREYPKDVEATAVGKFSFVDDPRGFCINSPVKGNVFKVIHSKYNL